MLQQVEIVEPHGSILNNVAVPAGNADGFVVFEGFDMMLAYPYLVDEQFLLIVLYKQFCLSVGKDG